MLKRILSQDITIPAYLVDPKEKEYQDTDPIDNMLLWIRKCNEFLRLIICPIVLVSSVINNIILSIFSGFVCIKVLE